MKILALILLSMITLLQSFSKWIILADYEINKEYIAQNLCINKSKPKLHCHGKCQLMKKLAEEEKQNSSNNNNPGKVKFQDIVYLDTLPLFTPGYHGMTKPKFRDGIAYAKYQSPISSIFHPPSRS
jgi:hypothetical protein